MLYILLNREGVPVKCGTLSELGTIPKGYKLESTGYDNYEATEENKEAYRLFEMQRCKLLATLQEG